MEQKLTYMFTRKDGSIIMDTGVSGKHFGNNGFGVKVLKKCNEYGKQLINKQIRYDNKNYIVMEYDILKGFLGDWGSIFIKAIEE